MSNPIKTGLIGFGTGGAFFHAPILQCLETFDLTTIVERTTTKSKTLFPNASIVTHAEALVTQQDIELVVITTPNDTHFELAKLALLHGKHVVIDKPFTVTVNEGKELIALAEKNGKLLSVYHNRRYHCDFRTVQQLVNQQKFGDIQEVRAHFDRYRPELRPLAWKESNRKGAGILYDLGSHLIDMMLCLFGKPAKVKAFLNIERKNAQAVDKFELHFLYPDFKAILHAGMLIENPGPYIYIKGTKASYIKFGTDPQEQLLRDGKWPNSPLWAMEKEDFWGEITENETVNKVKPVYADYRDYYTSIFNAVRKDAPLEVTAQQALLVIEIIEKAIQSNVENNAEISL